MGAIGLPGDLSSASRFVRAAFTKFNSRCSESETSALSQFFHILGSVAQTDGCAQTGNRYEITIYTSCCNMDQCVYYYTTYQNNQISAVSLLSENLETCKLIHFPLANDQQIQWVNQYTGEIPTALEDSLPIRLTRAWLDDYFSGHNPPTDTLPTCLNGTAFQQKCWALLQKIPYGRTVTYKDLAHHLAKESQSGKMSCQAVGQAIHKNPIAIIIPCHRVIGSNGALTGYAGGLGLKERLLILEKAI